eukprot:3160379-Prymnesium_polylepis.1
MVAYYEGLLSLAGPTTEGVNRWSSTGGVDAPTTVAPAGAPTPPPVPPRSTSTVGRVRGPPALP